MNKIMLCLLVAAIIPSICYAQNGKPCNACKGEGSYDCWVCRGSGETMNYTFGGINYVECKSCDGTGIMKCPVCRGKGSINRPKKGKNTYYHIKSTIIPVSTGNPPELIEDDPSDPNNSFINVIIQPREKVTVTNIYGQSDVYKYNGKNESGMPLYTRRSGETVKYLQVKGNYIEIKYSLSGIIFDDVYQKF